MMQGLSCTSKRKPQFKNQKNTVMSHRKRINRNRIETVYLLNTSIDKLNEEGFFTVRVYLHLRFLKVKNLAEFREIILNRYEKENEEKLERFGLRSVQEINDLFHRANVSVPETW